MGNIVIVHYLPNIIAPCELDLAFIDVEDEVAGVPRPLLQHTCLMTAYA